MDGDAVRMAQVSGLSPNVRRPPHNGRFEGVRPGKADSLGSHGEKHPSREEGIIHVQTVCKNTDYAYFRTMQATLTEVHRQAKRVFRPVQSGQPVRITEHGKPFARIIPEHERRVVSLSEFYKAELTDAAILEAIHEARA